MSPEERQQFENAKRNLKVRFKEQLKSYFEDPDLMVEAFNARESLIDKSNNSRNQFTRATLTDALSQIESGITENYQISDLARNKGFVESKLGMDFDSLPLIEALTYNATAFAAHGSVLLDINKLYFPLYEIEAEADFYLENQQAFEKELYEIASQNLQSYYFKKACLELEKNCTDETSPVHQAAKQVLAEAKRLLDNNIVKQGDLTKLTTYIQGTTNLIQNPDNQKYQDEHAQNIQQAMELEPNWGKRIGISMLVLLGVVLIAAAVVVAVATFGAAAPLSAVASVFGGSMLAAGLTTGALASAGTASIVGAGFWAKKAPESRLGLTMQDFQAEIKSTALAPIE